MNFYNYFIYPYRYHTCKSNAVLLTFSRNVNNTALENVDVMTYILHPFAMPSSELKSFFLKLGRLYYHFNKYSFKVH